MPGPLFRRGDRVSLRPVAEEDYAFLQRNWNDPAVRPGFGLATPTSESDVEERVDAISDDDEAETFLVCAEDGDADADSVDGVRAGGRDTDGAADGETTDGALEGEDNAVEAVGEAFAFDLDEHHGRVEIGYWIAPAHQGIGYATEAAELLVDYAFRERRLHKVDARVLAFNDASRRVLESVGFEREGRRRDEFYVDGEYVDADLYGLVAADWRAED